MSYKLRRAVGVVLLVCLCAALVFVPGVGWPGAAVVAAAAAGGLLLADRRRLRASEEFNRSLMEGSTDCVKVLDAQGRLLHMNGPGLCGMEIDDFGAFCGRQWAGLWPADSAAEVARAVAAAAAGVASSFEAFCPTAKGTPRWWEVTVGPVRDGPGGPVVRLLAVSRDITRRRRAEDELRESEERFRTLADHMSQLAWMADGSGDIFWYNRRWYEYTGTTLEEMRGWGWRAAHHPDHVARVVERIRHSWDTGEPWEDTFPLRGADGGYRWFLSRAVPIRAADGRILRWFGTNTDITERRNLEQAVLLADRRKSEFLATLAHELRNPLAPIRNGLRLLALAAGDPEKTAKTRAMMDRQAAQLARLVDDLLDVGRIAQGKLELRRERTCLRPVVEAAVEASRPLLEKAGHRLSVSLPPGPVCVDGDPARLAQVVSNLLNNAAKYTPAGGLVAVALRRVGGAAEVTVTDDGVGIPGAMLDKVFDLFTQADRTLEKTTGGLGIGLALVRAFVDMHGGTVAVRSEGEGKGSEFVVRLPAVEQAAEPPAAPPPKPPPVARRVLVVDDNADSACSLAEVLEMFGHAVRTAHDGEAGVSAAEEFRPDVVLMDIGMPKLNGYEAARRIRGLPWGGEALLVATTGWGQTEDVRRALEAGFDLHIVKPVDPEALLGILAGVRPDKGGDPPSP